MVHLPFSSSLAWWQNAILANGYQSAISSYTSSGVSTCLTRSSDEDYGGLVLAQAQAVVVQRVQVYRARAAERRNTAPALDLSAMVSFQHQIKRLLRERHWQLVNKLIDQFNLALQTGSIAPVLALTLDEVRALVTQLFPSAGDR